MGVDETRTRLRQGHLGGGEIILIDIMTGIKGRNAQKINFDPDINHSRFIESLGIIVHLLRSTFDL